LTKQEIISWMYWGQHKAKNPDNLHGTVSREESRGGPIEEKWCSPIKALKEPILYRFLEGKVRGSIKGRGNRGSEPIMQESKWGKHANPEVGVEEVGFDSTGN